MKHLREILAKLAKTDAERDAIELLFRGDSITVSPLTEGACRLEVKHAGAALDDAKRNELLAKNDAGELVEIDLEIDAYEQKPGDHNRNFVRFRDGIMLALGRSGVGVPFLRNHDQGDVLARGGTVIASKTEKRAEGDYLIRMTVRLSAQWAVDLALRGLLDAVSIGWNPTGPVECSHCKAEIFSKCWHFPGDEIEADAKKGTPASVVEWVFTEAELIELSGVNIGGVRTARIKDIRALAANLSSRITDLRHLAGGFNNSKENEMDPEILKLLGLSATATMEEYTAAIAKRLNQGKADAAELSILGAEMKVIQADSAKLAAEKRQAAEDAFITTALGAGKIGKTDEQAWRDLYQLDAKRAEVRMGERPDGCSTPVGLPRQSSATPSESTTSPVLITAGGESKGMRAVLAQLAANPKALSFASVFGYEGANTLAAQPTTISNSGDLDAARVGFHAAFLQSLELKTDDPIAQIYTQVPSTKKVEQHNWMGDLPSFEKWDGDRKMAGLEAFKLTVENIKWANGLKIKNDDFKDDALGLLPAQVQALALKAKRHRFDLMVKLLLNGFDGAAYPEVGNGLAYDGAFFFSDSHRGGNDNKMTAALDSAGLAAAELLFRSFTTYDGNDPLETFPTHLIVGPKLENVAMKLLTQERLANGEDNINKGKYKLVISNRIRGTYDDYWFLADLSSPIKPLMFQMREEISTSAIVGQEGNNAMPSFMNDELWFGAQARYNAAYFEFRTIVGSAL